MVADFQNIPINSEVTICEEERILSDDTALALCIHLAQSTQTVEWNQNNIINAV